MRKNILVLALLFCGGFSLAAQSRLDASIYITPVTGSGSKPEDNSLFYKQLVLELSEHNNFLLAKTQNASDYSLVGSLARYFSGGGGQFVFHLELRNSKTGEIKVEGDLLYAAPDDVIQQVETLVSAMLNTIPEDTGIDDEWRNKLLYLGAALTWAPRIYDLGKDTLGYSGDPYYSFSFEYHFFNFLSLETGIELAVDGLKLSNGVYRDTVIEIPLLLKYVIKPGAYFMLEPYTGLYFNISPRKTTNPYPAAWLLGFQYGVKAGPGAVFIDARFARDFGKSRVGTGAATTYYQRNLIYFGLGYKYGLLKREGKWFYIN